MITIEDIRKPVQQEMTLFEERFRLSMKSKVPLLDKITNYILKRKGKQMRPLFVMLSADLCGGITESTYKAAALIELLHTATLVHDDVVDDSNERRGLFSINALWKNKVAVLVGDYLLAKGLLLALDNEEFQLLKIVSTATREMSEGELLQIEKARHLDIEESVYLEIIRKKTASLISSCCAAGAHSAGVDQSIVTKMAEIGQLVGMAFQIKDDIFDFKGSKKVGKPNGVDIKEQKMTLPLIYLLKKSSYLEKRHIIHIVKNHNLNPAKVSEVIKLVNDSGGIEYAEKIMFQYRSQALGLLKDFPDKPSRRSLENLITYSTERSL